MPSIFVDLLHDFIATIITIIVITKHATANKIDLFDRLIEFEPKEYGLVFLIPLSFSFCCVYCEFSNSLF